MQKATVLDLDPPGAYPVDRYRDKDPVVADTYSIGSY